jgi:hypothetical protein
MSVGRETETWTDRGAELPMTENSCAAPARRSAAI